MKTLVDFLDDAKDVTTSDGRTAAALGMSRSGISHARKTGSMDVDHCVDLAKILNIDPAEIISACHIARHPEARKYWAKWIAATVILSVGIIGQGIDFTGDYSAAAFDHAIYYTQFVYLFGCAGVLISTLFLWSNWRINNIIRP